MGQAKQSDRNVLRQYASYSERELLIEIHEVMFETLNQIKLQNEILCHVHKKKLPKNLIRRAASELLDASMND